MDEAKLQAALKEGKKPENMNQNEWDAMVKKYKASQSNTAPEGMDEAKLQAALKEGKKPENMNQNEWDDMVKQSKNGLNKPPEGMDEAKSSNDKQTKSSSNDALKKAIEKEIEKQPDGDRKKELKQQLKTLNELDKSDDHIGENHNGNLNGSEFTDDDSGLNVDDGSGLTGSEFADDGSGLTGSEFADDGSGLTDEDNNKIGDMFEGIKSDLNSSNIYTLPFAPSQGNSPFKSQNPSQFPSRIKNKSSNSAFSKLINIHKQ
jgi:hypothetical protein